MDQISALDAVIDMQRKAHATSVAKGWYRCPRHPEIDVNLAECPHCGYQRNTGDLLMLIVTELAEAKEFERNNHYGYAPSEILTELCDGNCYQPIGSDLSEKPDGFGIELADAVIRIMDLAELHGVDLGRCIAVKAAYNATRPHRHGGKSS